MPIRYRVEVVVMPLRDKVRQSRRHDDGGVVHAKRSKDAVVNEGRVGCASAKAECMSQQSHADVGILERVARRACQLMVRQKRVEVLDRIVGIRISSVIRLQVGRQPGQSGVM